MSVERPLQRLDDILPLAKRLLKGVDYSQHPIRLLGLSVSNPKEENGMNEHVSSGPVQLELEFKDDYIFSILNFNDLFVNNDFCKTRKRKFKC